MVALDGRIMNSDEIGSTSPEARPARISVVLSALNRVVDFNDERLTLGCFRTLLKLFEACEERSEGLATVALANLLYDPSTKQRTNVTRHLTALREWDLVVTERDLSDKRVHLNRVTDAGRKLCEEACGLDRTSVG